MAAKVHGSVRWRGRYRRGWPVGFLQGRCGGLRAALRASLLLFQRKRSGGGSSGWSDLRLRAHGNRWYGQASSSWLGKLSGLPQALAPGRAHLKAPGLCSSNLPEAASQIAKGSGWLGTTHTRRAPFAEMAASSETRQQLLADCKWAFPV